MAVVSSLELKAPEPSARNALMNKILQKCTAHGGCNLLRDGEKTGFVPRNHEKQMFDPSHAWELLTEEEEKILTELVAEGRATCTYHTPYQHSYNHLF